MAQVQRANSDKTDNPEATEKEPAEVRDQPATDSDAEKKPSVIRRHPIWIAVIVLALIALGVAAYFVWLTFFHPYETTDDAFVEARSFSVAAKVSGYVADTSATDNQHLSLAPSWQKSSRTTIRSHSIRLMPRSRRHKPP